MRHGTRTLIGGFNVATDAVLADIGQTRTERTLPDISSACRGIARRTPRGIW